MERINEKILVYNLLDEEGRREVDAYLAAHPDLSPLLKEAHAFEELLRQARRFQHEPPDDEVLAYFLATRHVAGDAAMPAVLQEAFARIEARLAQDAEVRARYQRLEQRLRALEAGSDATAQFERLTGLSLADVPPAQEPPPPQQRHAPDRPARIHRLHSRPLRWAVAAVLGLVVAYGLLFVMSQAMQSPLERLAWIEDEALSVEGYEVNFRGEAQAAVPATDAAFLEAIYLLREAKSSFLGLFPHYDEAQIEEAEARLRFAAQADESPFVQAEARYLLGKVLLAQDRVEEAREALQAVVDTGRNKAPEAQALLNELNELDTT